MNKKIVIAFIALTLVLAACGTRAASTPSVVAQGVGGGPSNEFAPEPTAAPAYSDAYKGPGDVTANTTALQNRLVIMNADLTIVVSDEQPDGNHPGWLCHLFEYVPNHCSKRAVRPGRDHLHSSAGG
jgi:flagellar basal body-associated protein FliL